MALTHLPTRVSAYASQPVGFVSAAEGFVFLSAYLAGGVCSGMLLARGTQQTRAQFWTRAFRLYRYHLALLVFAFTIAAAFAVLTGRPAVRNLLTFYFDSPVMAIISGSLLLYQPPLFDILPMYVIFLGLTPVLLELGAKHGWGRLLTLSVTLWAFAQVGGRRILYDTVLPAFGVQFPMEAGGSFDLMAWQLLWIGGLWLGARAAGNEKRLAMRTPVVVAALVVAALFLLWRHNVAGAWSHLQAFSPLLDKWRLGPLRVLNFAAMAVVVAALVVPLLSWLHISVFELLGRASLQVFCAHLLVCVASLGLIVDDDTPLTAAQELLVMLLALAAMLFVAKRSAVAAQRRRAGRTARTADG